MAFGLTSLAILGAIAGVKTYQVVRPGDAEVAPLSEETQRLVEQVSNGIKENQSRYRSISFTLDRTIRNLGITKEERLTTRNPNGKGETTIERYPLFRETYRYVVRGEAVRRETVEGSSPGRVETIFQRRQFDFDKKIRQAWLRDEAATAGLLEPLDPRCLGFDTPLMSLSDWFNRVRVRSATAYSEGPEKGIRVVALDRMGHELTVRFSASHSYLPVRVEKRFSDGALCSTADIVPRRLPEVTAWFPYSVTVFRWPLGVAADTSKPASAAEYVVRDDVRVNLGVPDDQFDYRVPKDTVVVDATGKAAPVELIGSGASMSGLFQNSSHAGPARTVWPIVVAFDAALLAACLVFRKRLTF